MRRSLHIPPLFLRMPTRTRWGATVSRRIRRVRHGSHDVGQRRGQLRSREENQATAVVVTRAAARAEGTTRFGRRAPSVRLPPVQRKCGGAPCATNVLHLSTSAAKKSGGNVARRTRRRATARPRRRRKDRGRTRLASRCPELALHHRRPTALLQAQRAPLSTVALSTTRTKRRFFGCLHPVPLRQFASCESRTPSPHKHPPRMRAQISFSAEKRCGKVVQTVPARLPAAASNEPRSRVNK